MDNMQDVRPKKMELKNILPWFGLLLVLMVGVYITSKMENKARAGKIDFDIYVMSQCPYGIQAESMVMKSMDGFEDYINFNVEYIASLNADGSFNSLHGESEVEGNIYQLCVKKYNPENFWPYLECQNKNYQDLKSSFESCANQVGIGFETIKNCAGGEEGTELLKISLAKAQELNVSGSPTFYLKGEKYTGPRTEIAIQRELCKVLENKPSKCKKLPQDKKFTAYLIEDSRCNKEECDTTRLIEQLETTFTKIEFEKIDYTTKDGREFYDKYKLTFLPALLMSKEVKETENYSQVERYLTPSEDLYFLAIGANHDPNKEICDNGQDDTGNGLVDCADPDCSGYAECREEVKGRLDLFVMSMCPYGTRALDAMQAVLDNFGNQIDFNIYYIANENADVTFQSLHGQPEEDENIRGLCAIKYYANNYMDYIWCRNKDISANWTSCAANFPKIKTCFEGAEGTQLHSQNIKYANELEIGASPTWMVNNRYLFNGIDAETVRLNFCKYNDVTGCENILGAATNVPAGACN